MNFEDYLNSLFSPKELLPKSKEWMFIALDSDTESNSKLRDEVLARFDFYRFSPNKSLPLPESTYVGKILIQDAEIIVDEIWKALKKENLEPTRIFGGKTKSWKVINKG